MRFTKRSARPSAEHAASPDDALRPYPANPASEPGQPIAALSQLDRMQLEVALYIESIGAELGTMARESRLDSLAYFLEMARIEASIQVERRMLQLDPGDAQPVRESTNF